MFKNIAVPIPVAKLKLLLYTSKRIRGKIVRGHFTAKCPRTFDCCGCIPLSVDNLTCFLIGVLLDKRLVVLRHTAQGHAHVGEAAIVEEGLHGDLLGEVGEHDDAVVGTLVGRGIAQR